MPELSEITEIRNVQPIGDKCEIIDCDGNPVYVIIALIEYKEREIRICNYCLSQIPIT